MNGHLKELEERISYQFKNPNLFSQALTHSSYANEHRLDHNRCNERLEFLGDAVLEIVTSDFLYHKYESLPEGDLTKIRASIVCDPSGGLPALGQGGGRHRRTLPQFRGKRCHGGTYRRNLSGRWFC